MTTYRRFTPTERAFAAIPQRGDGPLDSVSYSGILSTDEVQKDGMAVLAGAWDLSGFRARGGPLIVEHNRLGYPQAGFVDSVRVEGGRLVGSIHVVSGTSAYADAVRRLMRAGARVGLSVGFNVTSERAPSRVELARGVYPRSARVVTGAELVELSLVTVAMDKHAQLVGELANPENLYDLASAAGLI